MRARKSLAAPVDPRRGNNNKKAVVKRPEPQMRTAEEKKTHSNPESQAINSRLSEDKKKFKSSREGNFVESIKKITYADYKDF